MTKIMCHPDPATLLSFAAGSLSEPLAAVVAGHLEMCATCRAEVADLELLGSLLLADFTPAPGMMATSVIPERPVREQQTMAALYADTADKLPLPLLRAFQLSFDTIPWKRLGPGVWHHRLPLSAGVAGDLRLLKIAPGRVMPDHGHGGSELTLVLDGAYSDESGSFRRGDIQDVDETVEHAPVADRESGCICLIASERPARFKSFVGRLTQPWTRM